jgi:hypothetical protein
LILLVIQLPEVELNSETKELGDLFVQLELTLMLSVPCVEK